MSSSKITLFTFAKWMQQYDKDLFKELLVPAGIEKDVLVDNILLRGGEFEVVYSDPDFMQYAIGSWSRKWYRTMEKWIQALSIDYHPLENYDRYETFQDDSDKSNNMDRTLDHADTLTINTQDLLTLGSQDKITHNTEDKTLINTKDLRTIDTKNKETKDLEDVNLRNLKDEEVKNLKDTKNSEGEVVNLKNLQDVDVIGSTETTTYDHTTTSEQLVSAYDSSSYQPSAKTINTDGEVSGGGLDHNTVTLDRDSTETINRTGTERANNTGNETVDYTGTDTTNRTGTESATHTGTDTTENTGTDTLDKTGTETTGRTGTETTDHSGTETTGRTGTERTVHTGTISDVGGETAKSLHVGHTHGNIGITSSQQLLESELSISRWNIYENITDLFLTEFVIPIYT